MQENNFQTGILPTGSTEEAKEFVSFSFDEGDKARAIKGSSDIGGEEARDNNTSKNNLELYWIWYQVARNVDVTPVENKARSLEPTKGVGSYTSIVEQTTDQSVKN